MSKNKKTKAKSDRASTGRVLFASLFNNNAAVEGGRFRPWWIAVMLFFVSIIIATIPSVINVARTKGQDILNGDLYHTEVALAKFGQALEDKNIDLVYEDSGNGKFELTDKTNGWDTAFAENMIPLQDSAKVNVNFHYFSYKQTTLMTETVGKEVTRVEKEFEYLKVFYVGNLDNKVFVDSKSKIVTPYQMLQTHLGSLKEDVTSYIIFDKKQVNFTLYNPINLSKSNKDPKSFTGRADDIKEVTSIKELTTKVEATSPNYAVKVLDNYKALFNVLYEPVKVFQMLSVAAISSGFYALLSLLIGLVVFLITRGKYNANNDFTFFQSMRVGFWLLLAPAILTLIIGPFVGQQIGTMLFVMLVGMRSVWMSMKTLRPAPVQ